MMKKRLIPILSLLLSAVLLASVFPMSVFAAKEMYYDIKSIELTVTAPEPNNTPDFVGSDPSGLYSIDSIFWVEYTGTAEDYTWGKAVTANEAFDYSKKYAAIFSMIPNSELYSFNTAVTATVNGLPAVVEYTNSSSVTVGMFFPETEPFFKTVTHVDIMEATPPMAGETPIFVTAGGTREWVPYKWIWTDSLGNTLTKETVFEEGKRYTLSVYLRADDRFGEFAVDNSIIIFGRPNTAVTATVNGSSEGVVVLPNNDEGDASTHIIVSKTFECVPSNKITNVTITGVYPPIAGDTPSYQITLGDSTYACWNHTNTWYNVGFAWLDGDDTLVPRNGYKFAGSTAYTLEVILTPQEGYEFKTDKNGNPQVTATVVGALAEVDAYDDGNIVVRYTFAKTENVEVSKVVVKNLDAPEVGKEPDYEITMGHDKYSVVGFENTSEPIVNGIVWINEDTKAPVIPGRDRFIGGCTYSVSFLVQTNHPYRFKMKDGALSTTATINGKEAEILSYSDTEIKLFYKFEPLPMIDILGDINRDGSVNISDALQLFMHSMLPDEYRIEYQGNIDFTKDGSVDISDALLLFMFSMLPDEYPIQ